MLSNFLWRSDAHSGNSGIVSPPFHGTTAINPCKWNSYARTSIRLPPRDVHGSRKTLVDEGWVDGPWSSSGLVARWGERGTEFGSSRAKEANYDWR
jgi:hypothetical protein